MIPPTRAQPSGPTPDIASWARPALRELVARGVDWDATPGYEPAVDATRAAAVLLLFGAAPRGAAAERHGNTGPAAPSSPGPLRQGGAPGPRDLDLLVIRRSTALRHHPGQVALPGGGREPQDADLAATALRETQEETGALPTGIEVIGSLAPFHLHVSRNLTTPVVAWWREPSPVWVADTRELDLVRRVPLSVLLDPERRVRAEIREPRARGAAGRVRRWTPAVELDEALMWGFTGTVVTQVLEALGWGPPTPWDRLRAVDPRDWRPRDGRP